MIEEKAIFEAAQTAFADEHPKFPWPKKHNLADQTDAFKRAHLKFAAEINAMHESEINLLVGEVNAFRERLTTEINAASSARENARVAARRADKLEEKIEGKNGQLVVAWVAVAILVVALIAFKVNS